jgi:hypothetical protein
MRVQSADSAKTLARSVRLGLFVAVVCATAGAFVLRSAHADVTEALWVVGSQLMAFPGEPDDSVRRLQLNGAWLSFQTRTVDASVADVLDHYEAACESALATQTGRSDDAGYVACLDVDDAPEGLGPLVDRFVRFSETGDLRELGALRYALARNIGRRSANQAFLLTMWSDSELNLYRMMPREGADAAGHDLVGVPRPAGSYRILSAWEERQPSGVLVYRVSAMSPAELEIFYRVALPRSGWTLIERHDSESVQVDGAHMLSAEKDNRLVTVLSHHGEASETILTILASEPA